jgi:hypothetical protein
VLVIPCGVLGLRGPEPDFTDTLLVFRDGHAAAGGRDDFVAVEPKR